MLVNNDKKSAHLLAFVSNPDLKHRERFVGCCSRVRKQEREIDPEGGEVVLSHAATSVPLTWLCQLECKW
jgi:hypothetical protein